MCSGSMALNRAQVSAGLLPGVMRSVLLADPMECCGKTLTLADLQQAEAVVVCNALRGALTATVALKRARNKQACVAFCAKYYTGACILKSPGIRGKCLAIYSPNYSGISTTCNRCQDDKRHADAMAIWSPASANPSSWRSGRLRQPPSVSSATS